MVCIKCGKYPCCEENKTYCGEFIERKIGKEVKKDDNNQSREKCKYKR